MAEELLIDMREYNEVDCKVIESAYKAAGSNENDAHRVVKAAQEYTSLNCGLSKLWLEKKS